MITTLRWRLGSLQSASLVLFLVFTAFADDSVDVFDVTRGQTYPAKARKVTVETPGGSEEYYVIPGTTRTGRWIGPKPWLLVESSGRIAGLYVNRGSLGVIHSEAASISASIDGDEAAIRRFRLKRRSMTSEFDQVFPLLDLIAYRVPQISLSGQEFRGFSAVKAFKDPSGFGVGLDSTEDRLHVDVLISPEFTVRGVVVNGEPIPLLVNGFEESAMDGATPLWSRTARVTLYLDGIQPSNESPKGVEGIRRTLPIGDASESSAVGGAFGMQVYFDKIKRSATGAFTDRIAILNDLIYFAYDLGGGLVKVSRNDERIASPYSQGTQLQAMRRQFENSPERDAQVTLIQLFKNSEKVDAGLEYSIGLPRVEEGRGLILIPVGLPEAEGTIEFDPAAGSVTLRNADGAYSAAIVH